MLDRSPKQALRRPRSDHEDVTEDIAPELLTRRLRQLADESLQGGAARWTHIARTATREGAATAALVKRLPVLMHYLINEAQEEPALADLVEISSTLAMQELEVRKR